MSELISAREFAMNTLERNKYMISVIKIQRTWRVREEKLNEPFEKERMIAKMNKENNTIVIPKDFIGSRTRVNVNRKQIHTTTIIPNWDKMIVRQKKPDEILFNIFSFTCSHKGNRDIEIIDSRDGRKKDSSIFSRVLLYWLNSLNPDSNFFKDKGTSWLESPEKWESYIQETLKALDSNKKLLFWIDRGKTFKLYPLMHKSKINDLHINWKLYMNSVKIENIKKRKSMS